jgi:ribosomal protein L31
MNPGWNIRRWAWRTIVIVSFGLLEIALLISLPYVRPVSDTTVVPFINAQVAGNGGAENTAVLYYKTTQVGSGPITGTSPNCPYGWNQAYTSSDGYGPHYIALIGYDWKYTTEPTGGGWSNDPLTPVDVPFPQPTCFDSETPIRMADGTEVAIKDVKVGDYVASFDEKDPKRITYARVNEVLHYPATQKIKVYVSSGKTVITTLTHPFYVGDGQYRRVENLRHGDSIYTLDENNQLAPFVIEKFEDAGVSDVYNLSLAGPHNFFAAGFASHNVGGTQGNGGGGGGGGSGCFTADTMITMADRSRQRIDTVKIGDEVLSFDEYSRVTAAAVTATFVHDDSPTKITIIIGGRKVETTPVHPFYVGNGKFIEAGNLTVGDEVYILSEDESMLVPSRIERIFSNQGSYTTYNLEVDEQHTFFAGDFAVHNKGGEGGSGGSGGGGGSPGPGGQLKTVGLEPSNNVAVAPAAEIKKSKSFWGANFEVPVAKAQVDPATYAYLHSFVGIGSDYVCSTSQVSVVPINQYYQNLFTGSGATFYSDACSTSTDSTTGIVTTQCNRCRICVLP